MRKCLILVCWLFSFFCCSVAAQQVTSDPIVGDDFVAQETDGVVAVEAEHFFRQEEVGVRAFHITTPTQHPKADADGDDPHWRGASGNAYVEILPDTRRNHGEQLKPGVNFSNEPGKLAILSYKVHFNNPGRYYVWVRAYSTGSEDNGLHVGIDGTWPEHGQRLQWCDGKQSWWWESKQRTEKVHCGVEDEIYIDVATAGEHTISFSMREDGFEFDRWLMTKDVDMARPVDAGPAAVLKAGKAPPKFTMPEGESGDGTVTLTADKTWHPVTLSLAGPFAFEQNDILQPGKPNPFMDYRMEVTFSQQEQSFTVPGYFAADGNAAESSAKSGETWRAHFSPPTSGQWNYNVSFVSGKGVALDANAESTPVETCNDKRGVFEVKPASKPQFGDQSYSGMLLPRGTHLVFQETGKPFFKVGPDAPETMLGYRDFDDTRATKPQPAPIKSWKKHVQDWNDTDPTWKGGKGKGLIGAVNYLGRKGVNAFSFLTYNVDGDGGNVWPHVSPTDKMHFDCSKLDQWGIVFNHAQSHHLLMHFKLQETENDDWRNGPDGKEGKVAGALDGGNCGPQRKLYMRELVARFGHLNMLEWNLGEENTQSFDEQMAMAEYLDSIDAYGHNIVLHTYPDQQDRVYEPWVGKSPLTGLSLQNMWDQVHKRTLLWVRKSKESGRPWIVANDEQGQADQGVPPDPGYAGFEGTVTMKNGETYDLHDIRKKTLWGNLMAGGAGVMYYFGYKLPENDLKCEDLRSRDRSWDYCRIANEFLVANEIPIDQMQNMNALVGNADDGYGPLCLAKSGIIYLVYLPEGGNVTLDLSTETVDFEAFWFDPENGGELVPTDVATQRGACEFDAAEAGKDRVLLLRAK